MTKNKYDIAAREAFHYPEQSINTSSKPPSELLNKQFSEGQIKHNFIIDMSEGRISKMTENYKQSGGSYNNKYNYIINPLTNRKVSIYSILGNKILKKYLFFL